MPSLRRSLVGALSGTLLLSSCSIAAPPAPSQPQAEKSRRVLSTVACPDGGVVTPGIGVSSDPLEPVAKLPTGSAIRLDFKAQDAGAPAAERIYFAVDAPFTLRFVEGPAFEVIDGDARDGEATVRLPAGVYDGYVGTRGKPGGSIGISDPIYFLEDTWQATTGKRDWAHIGLRALPLPASYGLGDYRLRLDPRGLTAFESRWFPVTDPAAVPPVPPLPPAIASVTGPDEVAPGATAPISAAVSDPNGDALTYHWTTTMPDGQVVPGNPADGIWTAPLAAGTYLVGLAVEDGTYTTSLCEPLPIVVPNVCPEVAASGAWPSSVGAGQAVSLAAAASDANGDPLTWRWTASGGAITSNGSSATWTAPAAAGDYTLTAYAGDGTCEGQVSRTIRVIAAAPATYGQGTKVRVGLYATVSTNSQAIISQVFDLSGLPRLSAGQMMRVGYFKPGTDYGYVRETDNTGRSVGFSWNIFHFGTPSFYSYPATPMASFYVFGTSLQDGQTRDLGIFSSAGVMGGSAVLLDGNRTPLPTSRSTISTIAYPAGELITQLKVVKAVQKQTWPVRKYKIYFNDGAIGETDTYALGYVTGQVVATSTKGSVVMPVGTRFRCGVGDNALVYAESAFTPVLPPKITRHF